jgi:hypothetical protein
VRFVSGAYLAGSFPPPFRIAAHGHSEDINRFGETTAINRGAEFRIFASERLARRWLLATD